jgi:hypothetical protein
MALSPTNGWHALTNDIPGTGASVSVPVTVTNTQQFFRLRVRLNE